MFTRLLLVVGGALAVLALLVGLPPSGAQSPLTPQEQALIAQKQRTQELPAAAVPVAAHRVVDPVPGAVPYLTYDGRTAAPKDPINVLFVGGATPWDVSYDLQHWTAARWVATGGGTQVALTDSGAAPDVYQLKPAGDGSYPSPRTHVRLFALPGSAVATAADAHHDNTGHTCTNDWQGPAARLARSFEDSSGRPLWFVSGIYRVDGLGAPQGVMQCAWYDGSVTVVDLRGTGGAPFAAPSGLVVTNVRVDRGYLAGPGLVRVSGDVINRGSRTLRDVRVGLAVDATDAGSGASFAGGGQPPPIASLPAGARRHFQGSVRLGTAGWARVGIAASAAGAPPVLGLTAVRVLDPAVLGLALLVYAAAVLGAMAWLGLLRAARRAAAVPAAAPAPVATL